MSANSRPPQQQQLTWSNDIVKYSEQLKQKYGQYFGDSPEAKDARSKYLTEYYEALISGDTSKIDMFAIDAIKLNISEEDANALFEKVIENAQKNGNFSRNRFRLYNGERS